MLKSHKWLVLVYLAFLCTTLLVSAQFPVKTIWGDEARYLNEAYQQTTSQPEILGILPGGMPLHWQPAFTQALYSLLRVEHAGQADSERLAHHHGELTPAYQRFFSRVSWINVVLLMLSGLLLYNIGLLLGLSQPWSTLATALLLFNPRIQFYQQALWPEILHLSLLLAASFAYLYFIKSSKPRFLAVSGLCFAYCSFTKGVTAPYVLLLSLLLIVWHRQHRSEHTLYLLLGLFLGSFLLLTHLQKFSNWLRYDDYALASNSWINIEAGLIPPSTLKAEGYKNIYDRYRSAAADPAARERLSKQRVIAYIEENPLPLLINNQVRNYFRMLNYSYVNKGITLNRWHGAERLMTLPYLCVTLSWLIVILGLLGLIRFGLHSYFSATVGLFLGYYLCALFIVGFNPRFLIQALPFLTLFTALTLQQVFSATGENDPHDSPALITASN